MVNARCNGEVVQLGSAALSLKRFLAATTAVTPVVLTLRCVGGHVMPSVGVRDDDVYGGTIRLHVASIVADGNRTTALSPTFADTGSRLQWSEELAAAQAAVEAAALAFADADAKVWRV